MDDTFTLEDFDFSNLPEPARWDDANDTFADINFGTVSLDSADFEDCFGPLVQQQTSDPTKVLDTLPQQSAELIPSILEPSVDVCSQQPQFVNPRELANVYHQLGSLSPKDYVECNDMPFLWANENRQQVESFQAPAYNLPLNSSLEHTTLPPMVTQTSSQLLSPSYQPMNPAYPPPPAVLPQYQPWTDPQMPAPPGDNGRSSRIPSRSPNRTGGSIPSQYPPSPATVITDTPPLKRPDKNHNGVPLRNDKIPRVTHRKKKQEAVEPELYYGPSFPKPQPWGPKNERDEYLFTYTEKGELAPGKFFTRTQMRYYLLGPTRGDAFDGPRRLKGVKAKQGMRREGLTLWIGWPAAMANDRYPRGGESTKCRFLNCQYSQTIKVGEPWVIFDERNNEDGEAVDPFHNAGYCHLYCLEFSFDIIQLATHINIRADYRKFKREEYDYFNLSNKLPQVHSRVVATWWEQTVRAHKKACARGERRKRDRPSSLDQALVNYKLSQEPKAHARNRQKRGGIDISKHRNDPELKRKLQVFKKNGLLDENGNPVQDADAQLEAIEHANKRQRRRSKTAPLPAYVPAHPLPPPPPGFNEQFICTGGKNATQYGNAAPVYGANSYPYNQMGMERGYSNAAFVNVDRLMTEMSATQTISVPAKLAGSKRGWDETAVANNSYIYSGPGNQPEASLKQEEHSRKRARLDDIPERIDPEAENKQAATNINDPVADYHMKFETHDGLPAYYLNDDNGAATGLDDFNAGLHEPDLTTDLDEEALREFFGAQEAAKDDGKLIVNTNEHVDGEPTSGEPLPTGQEETHPDAHSGSHLIETEDIKEEDQVTDNLDNLFGSPEDRQS